METYRGYSHFNSPDMSPCRGLRPGLGCWRPWTLRTRCNGDTASPLMTYADVELDEEAHEVRRAGELVQLSPTEFNLLRSLMLNAGKVVSKTQILDRAWNYDFGGDSRIVESYISYLRRKIDRTNLPLIHTIRGVGYTLGLPRDALDTEVS
jgi:DNA-binding response OmpR family regulator